MIYRSVLLYFFIIHINYFLNFEVKETKGFMFNGRFRGFSTTKLLWKQSVEVDYRQNTKSWCATRIFLLQKLRIKFIVSLCHPLPSECENAFKSSHFGLFYQRILPNLL